MIIFIGRTYKSLIKKKYLFVCLFIYSSILLSEASYNVIIYTFLPSKIPDSSLGIQSNFMHPTP